MNVKMILVAFALMTVNFVTPAFANEKETNGKSEELVMITPEVSNPAIQKEEPVIFLKGDQVYVSYLNSDKKFVAVSFKDESLEDIHTSYIGCQRGISKAFSIQNLSEGEYHILLSSGKEHFKYDFIVK